MHDAAKDIDFLLSRRTSKNVPTRRNRVDRLAKQSVLIAAVPISISAFMFFRLIRKRTSSPKLIFHSLTVGQAFPKGRSEEFIEFYQSKRFPFNYRSDEVLIELKGDKIPPKLGIATTRSIPFYLLVKCASWRQFVNFSILLMQSLSMILKHENLARQSIKSLIQIELELPLWRAITQPNFFVTTQSCMQNLPISFYLSHVKSQRLMLWYSTNNRAPLRVGEEFSPHLNAGELESFVDLHLIWNQEELAWLNLNGITKARVVGSIVFRPPILVPNRSRKYDIVYFDVTAIPRNDIFMSEEMLTTNLTILADCLETLKRETGASIRAYIKPKREHTAIHSKAYIDLRSQLVNSGIIQMINFDSNLYEIIASSRVVLAAPFTSPANISL